MALKGKNVRVRGKWWHYQFEASGQPYAGNTGLEGSEQNRIAAEKFAEVKRQAVLNPAAGLVLLESEKIRRERTFEEAAADFVCWARDVEYRSKPSTAERLRVSMTSCVEYFSDRPVAELDAAALEGYKRFRIEEHGVRDITVRHDLHALSVFFQWANRLRLALTNPVREITIPSDRDAVREYVISPEEEDRYLAAALKLHHEYVKSRPEEIRATMRPNMHDLAILVLEQGARPEELLAARLTDIDLDRSTLWIRGGKSRSARRVLDLTQRSLEIIRPRVADGGEWLFPSRRRPGQHMTKLQATHDRICLEAGACFVIYDCRHTFATRAIAAGIDVPTVAAILGHSGLRTIYRYVHPTAEAKKLAMEKFEAAANRQKLRAI